MVLNLNIFSKSHESIFVPLCTSNRINSIKPTSIENIPMGFLTILFDFQSRFSYVLRNLGYNAHSLSLLCTDIVISVFLYSSDTSFSSSVFRLSTVISCSEMTGSGEIDSGREGADGGNIEDTLIHSCK